MGFQFKQFNIEQKVNAHKVGTDSMVLGAWIKGDFKNILDIGTGTGVLALMQAQKQSNAKVIGIEPNKASCVEAKTNFENSPFANRIKVENIRLQDFEAGQPFDLIVSNPPYFVDSTLGPEDVKNSARHTLDLSIEDLYGYTKRLLSLNGQFTIVIPAQLTEQHLKTAAENDLFPLEILTIINESKQPIRSLISYQHKSINYKESQMIVKYQNGMYSKAYVDLTVDFHDRELPYYEG